MQSKFTSVLPRNLASAAGRVLLVLCLGLVSAYAAPVVFTASGSFVDGAVLSGTLTIDTVTGSATAVNIGITPPGSFTSTFIQVQGVIVASNYTLILGPAATGYPTFVMTLPVGTLVGYAGGAMNPTLSNYSLGAGNISLVSGALTSAAPPTIIKAFGAAAIGLNQSTSLTLTVTNPNASPLSAIAFTDTLPAGLVVATPNGLTSTCGGTATAVAGSGSVSLAAGSVAASSSCTVSVNVTGTVAGTMVNSVTVSDGVAGTGNTSTASLTVLTPPSISKTFGAPTIPLNGTTSLTLAITNPNGSSLSAISFTDTLPAGLVVATPNGLTSTCGGTATAVAGSGSVSLSGGGLAASGSCAVAVNVKGISGGLETNSVTVSDGVAGTGNTSTASLTVLLPPVFTSKTFADPVLSFNPTTTVSFVISNPNGANALTGVGFTDTLPAGLSVSTPSVVSNTCGGTVSAVAGGNLISLSGGTISAGSSCTVTVNVTGDVLANGPLVNITSTVTSTNGGTGTTTGTASVDNEQYILYLWWFS